MLILYIFILLLFIICAVFMASIYVTQREMYELEYDDRQFKNRFR